VTEITSGEDERDECKRTAEDASKSNRDDIKTGAARLPREKHGRDPTYGSCGVRCIGGVTLNSGFRRELENLGDDAKGKGSSGRPARPKVPRRPLRGGPSRSSGEAG